MYSTNRIYKCTQCIDTESDEDTELAEEQIAMNHRQELTSDPLPSVVQFENLENQICRVCPWGK